MHKDAQKKAPHSPAAQRPSDLLHFLLRYLLNSARFKPDCHARPFCFFRRVADPASVVLFAHRVAFR
jgi:hypothetical protein